MDFLLVFTLAVMFVSLLGLVREENQAARRPIPVLLHNGDTHARARTMGHYYIHVQDSVSG